EDMALRIDRGADAMLLLTRVVRRDQMLAAVLDPFHRPPESQCRRTDEHILGIELTAHPEAAADVALVELHRSGRAAEHAGDLVAVPVRHLGGAVKLQ